MVKKLKQNIAGFNTLVEQDKFYKFAKRGGYKPRKITGEFAGEKSYAVFFATEKRDRRK